MHPTMGAFHDPLPCLVACFLLECLSLLVPSPEVRGEPELDQEVTDLVKVRTFIEAYPLGIV
jgi:hypothetical protein